MCGIVGYIGPRDATAVILEGLTRLEYRGYDSAGIAVLDEGQIEIRRDSGKLERLKSLIQQCPLHGNIGIGHTRWATHGQPSARNAHPHLGSTGTITVVHNGIIENQLTIKEELSREGIRFNSDTDTEVIVHLVEKEFRQSGDLAEAFRKTILRLKGSHAVVMLSSEEPETLYTARIGHGGGIVLGKGEGEMFIASDIPAILSHTSDMIFLEPGQIAVVGKTGAELYTLSGKIVEERVHHVAWEAGSAEKGEYQHFMLKEIYEQPQVAVDTLSGRVDFSSTTVHLSDLDQSVENLDRYNRMVITACGTASHAGMVGKVLIENFARIPVEVDIASEFRYRDPIVDGNTIVLAISQSGETADTLAAMAEAKQRGALIWSIVNVVGSQAMRSAHGSLSMRAGPEIGVASTKAYLAPLLDLYLLGLWMGKQRGTLSEEKMKSAVLALRNIPELVASCLYQESNIRKVAKRLEQVSHCLYLGRGINMPTAYEGALKLKEISYIHAEAYPAGEMKHGPIALIDKDMPVIALVPRDPWYEKMLNQVQQVRARGGYLIVVATEGDDQIADIADEVIWVPETPWRLSPVTTVVPLQLLAYHTAVLRGADVDQPRNLAKSVTVE
ncbi:MAG: glutamine--fructose-6-phosphate transaminase (isomerizing) [Anaerolineales bacterium]|nr:glutamine--fructose-6-phosphate transaminase (isomerizing) [Anaerolineales bacterium]